VTLQECTGWFVVLGTALKTRENLLQHKLKKLRARKIEIEQASLFYLYLDNEDELEGKPKRFGKPRHRA